MKRLLISLRELAAAILFNFMSLPRRWASSASTVIGIAGVITVLLALLSIATGFDHTLTSSGRSDTLIVLRSGVAQEVTSGLSAADVDVISEIARAQAGADVVISPELYLTVTLPIESRKIFGYAPLRGVGPSGFDLRGIQIVEGRTFTPGRNEVVVGSAASRLYGSELKIGSTQRWAGRPWQIVGIFSSRGTIMDSEVWTDARTLQSAYHSGTGFQSVRIRLPSERSIRSVRSALESDPRIGVVASVERTYYAQGSRRILELLRSAGLAVAALMAIGAIFGALNTMHAAVSTRTSEIALLRALGFGAGSVVVSVLAESLFLAALGCLLAIALAMATLDGMELSSATVDTFAQVAFNLTITRKMLWQSVPFALTMGLLGGLVPAIRAARQPIVVGLQAIQ